jgi:hypothetical protein
MSDEVLYSFLVRRLIVLSIDSFFFFGAFALALVSCVYVYQHWAIERDRPFAAFFASVIIVLAFFFLMPEVYDLAYVLWALIVASLVYGAYAILGGNDD